MEPNELTAFLGSRIQYPTDVDDVRDSVGDVEVTAPDPEDTVTIGTLLADVGEDRYESPELLYEFLTAQLPEAYVGRKFYDDRGDNVPVADEPVDERNRSF